MTPDNWLAIFIIAIFFVTGYLIVTKPNDEGEERD